VNALLAAGADPNLGENYGFTPLHEAAENGREEIARALLAANADPSRGLVKAFDKYPVGATPVDVARLAGKAALATLLSPRSPAA
jgi:cytohesin